MKAKTIDIGPNSWPYPAMHAITFSNARRNFGALFEKALSDRAPIAIVRHRGEGAVIMAESEWAQMEAIVNRRADQDLPLPHFDAEIPILGS